MRQARLRTGTAGACGVVRVQALKWARGSDWDSDGDIGRGRRIVAASPPHRRRIQAAASRSELTEQNGTPEARCEDLFRESARRAGWGSERITFSSNGEQTHRVSDQ